VYGRFGSGTILPPPHQFSSPRLTIYRSHLRHRYVLYTRKRDKTIALCVCLRVRENGPNNPRYSFWLARCFRGAACARIDIIKRKPGADGGQIDKQTDGQTMRREENHRVESPTKYSLSTPARRYYSGRISGKRDENRRRPIVQKRPRRRINRFFLLRNRLYILA